MGRSGVSAELYAGDLTPDIGIERRDALDRFPHGTWSKMANTVRCAGVTDDGLRYPNKSLPNERFSPSDQALQ